MPDTSTDTNTSDGQNRGSEHAAAGGGLHVVLISLYHFGAFGARILSDVLKKNGHTVSMVFFKRDKTNEMALPTAKEYGLLKNLIKDLAPGLVGVSTRSTFFPVARDITAAIKPETSAPEADIAPPDQETKAAGLDSPDQELPHG